MTKPWEYGTLSVRDHCPYLCNGSNVFFWMGDTAWLLFQKLEQQEMRMYLENRAERGFNVIQAAVVHHFPAANIYGQDAFEDQDVTRPDRKGGYWELVDYGIREAARLGMYLALLPHWGNFAKLLTLEEMERYVCFLAERYGKEPNIIWVTGGDTKGNEAAEYWRAMGQLLKEKCPEQLVTFHPFGRTSSIDYFADEPWVDFHMFQSGHRRYDQQVLKAWDDSQRPQDTGKAYYGEDNWRYVKEVRKLESVKPILDAEPSYEHIPQGLHLKEEPCWSPEQVRRYAWWSVLAGACGFTYGHNSVMQFYNGIGEGAFFVKIPWKDALHAPACDAMTHMKRVMDRVLCGNWQNAKSAEYLLGGSCVWQEEQKEERILAFHAGPWLLFYTYSGKAVELNGSRVSAYMASLKNQNQEGNQNTEVRNSGNFNADLWWMNPGTGVESYCGRLELTASVSAIPVPSGDDSHKDWLLIVKLL